VFPVKLLSNKRSDQPVTKHTTPHIHRKSPLKVGVRAKPVPPSGMVLRASPGSRHGATSSHPDNSFLNFKGLGLTLEVGLHRCPRPDWCCEPNWDRDTWPLIPPLHNSFLNFKCVGVTLEVGLNRCPLPD